MVRLRESPYGRAALLTSTGPAVAPGARARSTPAPLPAVPARTTVRPPHDHMEDEQG